MKRLAITSILLAILAVTAFADDDAPPKVMIGIRTVSLDDAKAAAADKASVFPTNLKAGLVVSGVVDGSPAEKAGIKECDIITRVGSKDITGLDALREWASTAKVGTPVRVMLMRVNDKAKWSLQAVNVTPVEFVLPPPDKADEPEKPATLTPGNRPSANDGLPRFDIQGQHIGDVMTPEWAYQHCPGNELEEHLGYVDAPNDGKRLVSNGKATDGNITGTDHIEVGDKTVIVAYRFADRKLVGVALSFDTSMYDTLKQTYTDKFGKQPAVSNKPSPPAWASNIKTKSLRGKLIAGHSKWRNTDHLSIRGVQFCSLLR